MVPRVRTKTRRRKRTHRHFVVLVPSFCWDGTSMISQNSSSPMNPKTRQIALSTAERIAWVEKLYRAGGLLPKVYTAARPSEGPPSTEAAQEPTASTTMPAYPNSQPPKSAQAALSKAPTQPAAPAIVSASQQHVPLVSKESRQAKQPTAYPHDTFLDWVAAQVARDPEAHPGDLYLL